LPSENCVQDTKLKRVMQISPHSVVIFGRQAPERSKGAWLLVADVTHQDDQGGARLPSSPNEKQNKREKKRFCFSPKISSSATFDSARCNNPRQIAGSFCETVAFAVTHRKSKRFFTVSLYRNSGPILRPSAAQDFAALE